MAVHLRPLEDQTIVLTGASSGIGLVTARMAARRGARLVLAARTEDALRDLAEEIARNGGEAHAVVCDVGNQEDVRRLRDAAIDRFGGFDTWVNDAGIGMFGRILDIPVDDMKRLFDTNVWGVVHGSIAAAEYFRDRAQHRGERGFGGAIINVGSVVSYQAIPLQGPYVASKHAVLGFTDSLRQELEHDGIDVSLTCVMPNAIDTPYPHHAPNYMGVEATLPPPVYAPETVARVILRAATHPTRNITVGGAFKTQTALNKVVPGLIDAFMRTFVWDQQRREDEPIGRRELRGLEAPSGRTEFGALHERGDMDRWTMPFSAYTEARMHPLAATAVLAGIGLLVGAAVREFGSEAEHAPR